MREDNHLNQAAPAPAFTNLRISWGAIIAGALVAISIQLLLTVLGMAIGLNVAQDGAGQGLAIGAGVWWIVTGSIALFFGGWVAGHACRSVERRDAMLQGFVQWTLVTAVSALLVTSAIGSVFGGALSLTSTVGSAAGETVQAVVPDTVQLPTVDVPWEQVQDDVEEIIAAYAPQAVEQQGGETTVDLVALARTFLTNQGEAERQELIAAVRAQFGITEAEADQMTTQLQQTYQQVQQTAQQTLEQTQETVVEAAQTTAEVSADVAWWTFFSLLLGAVLATVGGAVGGRTGGPLLHRAMPLRPVTT
jgi:hypothetical protein